MNKGNEPVTSMDATGLRNLMGGGGRVVIVDVRSADEFAAGHIETAINIPGSQLAAQVGEFPADAIIVTVCSFGGSRSCTAAELLQTMGRGNAVALAGGMSGWQEDDEQFANQAANAHAAKH